MTYHLTENETLDVDGVTEESLSKVLQKAISFADSQKHKSISIPVLCTRGNYGLHPEKSLRVILTTIKESTLNSIKSIKICFESEGPREMFDNLTNEKLAEWIQN